MDLAAITSAGASLKTAADLAKAFFDVKAAIDVQGRVFELQRVILTAQQDTLTAQQTQASLVEANRQLEDRIRRLESWDLERDRYALTEVSQRVYAYRVRDDARGEEPDHWLCANCYQAGKKSILQSLGAPGPYANSEAFSCPACRNGISVHREARPLP